MNRMKNTGLVLCGLVLGLALSSPAARAVESLKATLSTNRILVDGQETHMTAYTIGGSNYVRLRDIGKAVGFEVYWDSENGCVSSARTCAACMSLALTASAEIPCSLRRALVRSTMSCFMASTSASLAGTVGSGCGVGLMTSSFAGSSPV